METALETYRKLIDEQPTCDDVLFTNALAQFRSGDEAGARAISGSCLRLAMRIAECRAADFAEWPLLDVIHEANAGLYQAITAFPGSDLHDFLLFAEEKIDERLTVLV